MMQAVKVRTGAEMKTHLSACVGMMSSFSKSLIPSARVCSHPPNQTENHLVTGLRDMAQLLGLTIPTIMGPILFWIRAEIFRSSQTRAITLTETSEVITPLMANMLMIQAMAAGK